MDSIGDMAKNAEYRGVNLLGGTGDDLNIQLDANGANFLNVASANFTDVENIDSAAFGANSITDYQRGITTTVDATTATGGLSEDTSLTDAADPLGYDVGDTITFDLDGNGTDTYTYTVDEDSTVSSFLAEVNGSGIVRASLNAGSIDYSFGSTGNTPSVVEVVGGTPAGSLATTGGFTPTTGLGADETAFFSLDANISGALSSIDSLKTTLSAKEGELANFEVITESFAGFAEQMVSLLEEGADNLVMADMEEESVKLNVLQTRQQLAMISISLGNQAEQNVLRLF